MALNPQNMGPNLGRRSVKTPSLRLSDTAARTTTDYADLIVGSGAPSGGYGRDASATMLYFRTDASSVATAVYVTSNGGTGWTAMNPAVLSTLDLDGNELIIDADADTSLTADTDDQIDIKISGADDFRFVANVFRALAGSSIETDSIGGTTLTTGTFAVTLADNQADALSIAESTNDYIVFATTNSAESVQVKQRLTTTDGVASGTARVVGGRAYSATAASTAIDGTQEAQTAFDANYTLPANTLKAGSIVRFAAFGKYTATTGAETHTLAVKLGSTTLFTSGNIDPSNNDYFRVTGEICVRTAGGAGTCVGWATMTNAASGAASQPTSFFLDSTALDTTAANLLAVYLDRQGTATDSDSARLDHLHVEVI